MYVLTLADSTSPSFRVICGEGREVTSVHGTVERLREGDASSWKLHPGAINNPELSTVRKLWGHLPRHFLLIVS